MSFGNQFKFIIQKYLGPRQPKPQRTRMPMRLSQDSAVTISIAPLILAEAAGSLFKSELPLDNTIVAAGRMTIWGRSQAGLDLSRAYLSHGDGAFIQFASRNSSVIETRLYRPYVPPTGEIIPQTDEEWAFFLSDNPEDPGLIGRSVMQSFDVDVDQATGNPYQYQRSWGSGNQYLSPLIAIETIVNAVGDTTTNRHRMMHYSRALTDPMLTEHVLVSAVETDIGASVDFWLGLDIADHDLTVFATADAPI